MGRRRGTSLTALLACVLSMALAAPAAFADPVVVAAGDIACSPTLRSFNAGLGTMGPDAECHQKHTSDVAERLDPTVVLALGDTQYGAASLADYQASYDRRDAQGRHMSWGRFKDITRPIAGNHEYADRDPLTGAFTMAGGYFDYFNGVGATSGPAGERGQGYYSFDLPVGTREDGTPVRWHLVALNSQCASSTEMAGATGWLGGCAAGSPQEQWLRRDLAAASEAGVDCTLAYWHHPRFSAGGAGDNDATAPLWQALLDHDADLLLSGHHHNYQRLAQLDAAGDPAPRRGVRQFVVGTGGRELGALSQLQRQVEVVDNTTFGVLELTLHDGWYEWRFVGDGMSGSFTDAGHGECVKLHAAVTSGPEGLTGPGPTFAFDSSRRGASLECRLDDQAWAPCSSPVTYAGLPDGGRRFETRAIDPASGKPSEPAARTFNVDATPPAVAITSPAAGALAGIASLAATATDASGIARVEWLLDGAPLASGPSVAWDTFTVRDGRHTLVAVAVDAVGNTTRSAPLNVAVRNAPPAARPSRSAPRLTVDAAARQRLLAVVRSGLRLTLRCDRPCRAEARVTVSAAVARALGVRPTLAKRADRRLRTRRTAFAVRLGGAARRRVSQARSVRVTVRVTATDAAGRRRTVSRSVLLR